MMRTLSATAHWQARLCFGWKDLRKRSQPEKQNQTQANSAPHGVLHPDSELNVRAISGSPGRAQDQSFLYSVTLIMYKDELLRIGSTRPQRTSSFFSVRFRSTNVPLLDAAIIGFDSSDRGTKRNFPAGLGFLTTDG
jgi:hypothetical protein